MRSPLTWLLAMLVALLCALGLQEWRLWRLERQLAGQGVALAEGRNQVAALTTELNTARSARGDALRARAAAELWPRRLAQNTAFWREDERRLLLSAYGDFLAQAQLPPATLGRLQDLLVERTEALADATDAAEREGFVAGSPEMAQATAAATGDLDREIAGLVGREENAPAVVSAPPQNYFAPALPVFATEEITPVAAEAAAGPEGSVGGFDSGFFFVSGGRLPSRGDGRGSPPRYFAFPRGAGDPPRVAPLKSEPPFRTRLAR